MKKLWLLVCAILLAQPAQAGFSYIDSGGNPQAVFNESAESSPAFTPEVAPPATKSSPKKTKAVNIRAKKPEAEAMPEAPAIIEDAPQAPVIAAEPASAPQIDMGGASVAPSVSSPFGITPLRAGQYIGDEPPAMAETPAIAASPAAPAVREQAAPEAPAMSSAPVAGEVIAAPVSDTGIPVSNDTPTDPKIGNQSLNPNGEIVARVVMDDGYVVEVPKQTEQERRAYERYARTHDVNSSGDGGIETPRSARAKAAKSEKSEKPKAEKPKTLNPRMGQKPEVSRPTASQRKEAAKPERVIVDNPPEAFIPDEPKAQAPVEAAVVAPVEPVSEPEPPVVRESEIAAQGAPENDDPSMHLVPPASASVPDFVLEKGSLKDQLTAYARSQGYRLEWKHPADLMVTNSTVFSKGNFAGNIRSLFETLQRIGKYGLSAKLYNGDHTLVVE